MRTITRRGLLKVIGLSGGSVALYNAAAALGAVPASMLLSDFDLKPGNSSKKVLILGAGLAGLVSAFELQRAGFQVEILEASHRIGGRSLTLRHGDIVDEIGNRQICQFDDHPNLYFNAGPARIPAQHVNILNYCRGLGVELEPFINANPSAWIQYDDVNGGVRMRQREYFADTRGFLAELLAKGVSSDWLDQPLSERDKDRFLEFLTSFGDLAQDHKYKGSSRAGTVGDGLLYPGKIKPPKEFAELLKAGFSQNGMIFGESEQQSSVLQPVGGMDKIIHAFAHEIGDRFKLNAQVNRIETGESGVEVVYRHNGRFESTRADYCLNSIPAPLLAGLEHNFSNDFQAALIRRPRGMLGKIGLQMSQRFWESEGIYGGISWTGQDIGQIMYPPSGFHSAKGVVVGGYFLAPEPRERFLAMTAEERLAMAKAQGEKLHPGYSSYVENGVSVAWYRMNHQLGCTAREVDEPTQKILIAPQGRHFLIGDQVAHHAGWQESALLTAHHALNQIGKLENAALAGTGGN